MPYRKISRNVKLTAMSAICSLLVRLWGASASQIAPDSELHHIQVSVEMQAACLIGNFRMVSYIRNASISV